MANRWPYNTALWKKTRKAQLSHEPLCRMCKEMGYYTEATVVDHIVKVEDDPSLAFEGSNLQGLCKHCHDSHKQSYDRGSGLRGWSKEGVPVDPHHHWRE